jgi:diguanylate cyclase (GGDEF)-like protein
MKITSSSLDSPAVPFREKPVVRRWAWIALILTLAGIFALDRATERAPVQHLYYLPIIFSAVIYDWMGGLSTALAAIVLYHVANHKRFVPPYHEPDIVQVSLFLVIGLIAAKLTRDSRRFRLLAMTDDLTGLHNLRSFEAHFVPLVGKARSAGYPLVVLAVDCDNLKTINDSYGHLAGADAVRTVGEIIGAQIPRDAIACRYGGDEFLIALRGTLADGRRLADRLCRDVNASQPVLAGRTMPPATLSVSVGAAAYKAAEHRRSQLASISDAEEAEALFRSADAALYRAKANGRNCVQCA